MTPCTISMAMGKLTMTISASSPPSMARQAKQLRQGIGTYPPSPLTSHLSYRL